MRRAATVLPTLGAILLAEPAAADQSGAYVTALALAGLSNIAELSLAGHSAPIRLVDERPEWSVGGSVALGYRFPDTSLRAGIEYLWRYRFDIDAEMGNGYSGSAKADVDTHSVYMTAYVDLPQTSGWNWYLGGGLGVAKHRARTEYAMPGASHYSSRTQNEFSWMGIVGAQYAMDDSWSIDVSYRYTDLGRIETGRSDLGQVLSREYFSHDLLFGLSYRL